MKALLVTPFEGKTRLFISTIYESMTDEMITDYPNETLEFEMFYTDSSYHELINLMLILRMLDYCDTLALSHNWMESKVCSAAMHIAIQFNKNIWVSEANK